MQITVKFDIRRYHLEWAAYMLTHLHDTKLTKTAVRNYLKSQLEMFGIDDDSLMGEANRAIFVDDICPEYDDPSLELVRRWVKNNYKFEA
jgi:hypothetical protein